MASSQGNAQGTPAGYQGYIQTAARYSRVPGHGHGIVPNQTLKTRPQAMGATARRLPGIATSLAVKGGSCDLNTRILRGTYEYTPLGDLIALAG